MVKQNMLSLLLIAILSPCYTHAQNTEAQAKAKQDIMAAESAFCAMAKEKGVGAAFLFFAADDAVICRTTKVYKGKEGIKKYYDKQDKNDQLIWKPSFVSVSESADMGYTYGEYDFSGTRAGSTLTDHGIFHTIWKKQKDGSWKFVLD